MKIISFLAFQIVQHRSSVRLVIRPASLGRGPSLTPIIGPGERVTRSSGFLPRVTPVLPASLLRARCPISWTAGPPFHSSRRRRPRFKSSIRRDVRRRGCDDRRPAPIRSTANRPDALLLREHYPLLPVEHAARNRGPGRRRSRRRGLS